MTAIPTIKNGSLPFAHQNDQKVKSLTDAKTQTSSPKAEKKVSPKSLINKLNYINFKNESVSLNFIHKKYNNILSLHAKPQPCVDDRLECCWTDVKEADTAISSYRLKNMTITDGRRLITVQCQLISSSSHRVLLRLLSAETGVNEREAERYSCENLKTQMIQYSAVFSGKIVDFSAQAFNVEIETVPPQTVKWIDPKLPVNIIFTNDNGVIYSGSCRIIRYNTNDNLAQYILKPLEKNIQRYQPSKYRSKRLHLVPSPDIMFEHPLTGKKIILKVMDISGSGFAVLENEKKPALMAGMIIPELEIIFASSLKLKCKAQVIYQKRIEEENTTYSKCGIAILDMTPEDHVRLLNVLHQAEDSHTYVCNTIDNEELWDFFFETGFIYPTKYSFFHEHKDKIKHTYEKLYNNNPQIARHFIYQEKGSVLGHMSMLRFYENTWLIHHHASRAAKLKAGLAVLRQTGRLAHDSHRLEAMHMDYLMCYYRPDNKFPHRVFGGVKKSIADKKKCSIDPFLYFHFNPSAPESGLREATGPWEIAELLPNDYIEVESFYENESNGLMLKALDIDPNNKDNGSLAKEYQKVGLKKEKHVFSIKKDGELKAVVIINISDIGINMSGLTNCIKIIVLDHDDLPVDIVQGAIKQLSLQFSIADIPILLYPTCYAEKHSFNYEKIYNMWVLDPNFLDPYFKYVNRLLRFGRK